MTVEKYKFYLFTSHHKKINNSQLLAPLNDERSYVYAIDL